MDTAELRELLDTGVAMLGVSTDDRLVPEAFRFEGRSRQPARDEFALTFP